MSNICEFKPSEKLVLKARLSVLFVFVLFILPWALLALIPTMPPAFLWIFLGVQPLWLVPTLWLQRPYCQSIRYQLGDNELNVRRGIITHSEDTVPYAKITNIVIKRGPLDRWLGMGSLHVHTAGFSQQQGAEAKLIGLVEYEAVRDAILHAARRAYAGAPAPAEAKPVTAETEPALVEIAREILAELRAMRSRLERS